MNTTYLDPLIPPNETSEETLTRLSASIRTLTGLMNDAEQVGHYSLAAMFNRARNAKVDQAEVAIAQLTADGAESAEDRRFLLVRGVDSAEVVPTRPRPRPAPPLGQLALTP